MDATIDWLGHATLLIELDGVRILTDPTIRERIGPLDRKVPPVPRHALERIDAVLRQSPPPGPPRPGLDPPAGRAAAHRAGRVRRRSSGRPGIATSTRWPRATTTTHGPLTIEVVRADHSGFRPPFGPTGTRARLHRLERPAADLLRRRHGPVPGDGGLPGPRRRVPPGLGLGPEPPRRPHGSGHGRPCGGPHPTRASRCRSTGGPSGRRPWARSGRTGS